MSPSIFLISSILILMSLPTNISSPSLVRFACSNDNRKIDTKLCLRVLQPVPRVVAANDLFSLSVAIIESGISNATSTRRHLETALKKTRGALQDCKLAYNQVVSRFTTALRELKQFDYVAPTYDLLTASSDFVKECDSALAKHKVRDAIISRGNRVVPIFGISACSVVEELHRRSGSTTKNTHM